MPQVWGTATAGGYMYSDKLSNILRMELLSSVKFRQMCDIEESAAKGKHKGENWTWNVYSTVATKGAALVETATMPKTQFSILQRTGTITEYGNSIDYSGKLDDLSEHPVTRIIHKVLGLDARNSLDVAVHAQIDTTPLRVAPVGGTSTTAVTLETAGASTITNNVAFRKGHIEPIVTQMKERNIPPYIGDDYYALARPATFSTMRDDLEAVHQYVETGLAMIMNGEMGRYRSMRFIEQTHIVAGGAADSGTYSPQTDVADPWNNGLSDWIYFFGQDVVSEGIAVLEEIRGKIPGDYGRDRGIAWFGLLGYGLSHPDALNARVVKWDSAA